MDNAILQISNFGNMSGSHLFKFRKQNGVLKISDFQTPPVLVADELSNLDPGPSQRTQGWNTSARETLAADLAGSESVSSQQGLFAIYLMPG